MGTTALFAELVVGGILTLTWRTLAAMTTLGPSVGLPFLDGSPLTTAVGLALIADQRRDQSVQWADQICKGVQLPELHQGNRRNLSVIVRSATEGASRSGRSAETRGSERDTTVMGGTRSSKTQCRLA